MNSSEYRDFKGVATSKGYFSRGDIEALHSEGESTRDLAYKGSSDMKKSSSSKIHKGKTVPVHPFSLGKQHSLSVVAKDDISGTTTTRATTKATTKTKPKVKTISKSKTPQKVSVRSPKKPKVGIEKGAQKPPPPRKYSSTDPRYVKLLASYDFVLGWSAGFVGLKYLSDKQYYKSSNVEIYGDIGK
jgi:hypothetical protein